MVSPKPAGLRVHHRCVVGRRLEVLIQTICVTIGFTWERLGGQERTGRGKGLRGVLESSRENHGAWAEATRGNVWTTSATRKLSEREGGWGMEIGVPTSVGLSPR